MEDTWLELRYVVRNEFPGKPKQGVLYCRPSEREKEEAYALVRSALSNGGVVSLQEVIWYFIRFYQVPDGAEFTEFLYRQGREEIKVRVKH